MDHYSILVPVILTSLSYAGPEETFPPQLQENPCSSVQMLARPKGDTSRILGQDQMLVKASSAQETTRKHW